MKTLYTCGVIAIATLTLLKNSYGGYQEPDYEKIADQITKRTAKKLEQQNKLCLIGIGGQMMNDIQLMRMCFHLYREVTLEEARELVIAAANEYLSDINNNEKIEKLNKKIHYH